MDPMTSPVDRGWAWLVCGSAFMLQLQTLGITMTFGIIFTDLLDYFQENRNSTAWIGALQSFLLYSTGKIVVY